MTGNSSPPREGDHSPWGLIETATPIADGIVCVHTLSHGGIWLSEARLAQMSPEERSSDGWYEEDCEAAWPLRRFRDEVLHAFPAHTLDPFIDATISSSGDSFASIAMNRSPDMQLPTDEEADREVLDNIIAAIEAMNWAHETTAESVRRVNSILHEHEEGYRNEAQWNRIANAAYQRAEEKAEEDTLDHQQRPWFVCFGPHQCATLPEARERAGQIARTTGEPERVIVFRDTVDWTTHP